MRQLLFVIVAMFFATTAFGQNTFTQEEETIINQAYEYSDNGNAEKAIAIYNDLLKNHPGDPNIRYEIAYCYNILKQYQEAANVLEAMERDSCATGQAYAMHGNMLDYMGQTDLAIEKYKEGLRLFPKEGQLYVELGTVYAAKEDYMEAIRFYEEGIRVEPTYAPNYYRISILLCNSNEPIWGIIYGEIHELLLPNSERSEELSELIYKAYNDCYKFEGDTLRCTLTTKNTISIDEEAGKLIIPFEILYEVYSESDKDKETIREKGHLDMLSLVEKRKKFLTSCFEGDAHNEFLFPIFKFQQKVLAAGHWEAYNMYILRAGNYDEFDAWYEENQEKFSAFIDWYNQNMFEPTADD